MPSITKLELACGDPTSGWACARSGKINSETVSDGRKCHGRVHACSKFRITDSLPLVLTFLGILYYFLGIYYGMISVSPLEIKLIFFIVDHQDYYCFNIFWFYIVNIFATVSYIVDLLAYELY